MAVDGIVVVQQAPGGDRSIDNSVVSNVAGPGGQAYRQRVELYGALLARSVHFPEAALPAASAWTTQARLVLPGGLTRLTWIVRYTRAAAGGFVRLRPKWWTGSEECDELLVDSLLLPSGGVARQTAYLQELDGPIPDDGSPITFALPFAVPAGMTEARLLAAEAGAPSTPGTCLVAVVGGTV